MLFLFFKCTRQETSQVIIKYRLQYDRLLPLIEKLAQVFGRVILRRDHFEDSKAEAVDIELLSRLLFHVLLAVTAKQSKLLILGLCIDVFDADIADLNLAIIGVDVDRLTCQLAVHNVVFMENL